MNAVHDLDVLILTYSAFDISSKRCRRYLREDSSSAEALTDAFFKFSYGHALIIGVAAFNDSRPSQPGSVVMQVPPITISAKTRSGCSNDVRQMPPVTAQKAPISDDRHQHERPRPARSASRE